MPSIAADGPTGVGPVPLPATVQTVALPKLLLGLLDISFATSWTLFLNLLPSPDADQLKPPFGISTHNLGMAKEPLGYKANPNSTVLLSHLGFHWPQPNWISYKA